MRKLYLYSNGNLAASGWETCYAMADDGVILATHCCSGICFMKGDLIDNRPERKEMHEKHFGGIRDIAFEVVSLSAGELPPKEVMKLNDKLRANVKQKKEQYTCLNHLLIGAKRKTIRIK